MTDARAKRRPKTTQIVLLLISFRGRVPRWQLWLFTLLDGLVFLGLAVIDVATGTFDPKYGFGLLSGVEALLSIYAGLAVAVKRCHDLDLSGAYLLFGIIPLVGPIWITIHLFFFRGTVGDNKYGTDPLDTSAEEPLPAAPLSEPQAVALRRTYETMTTPELYARLRNQADLRSGARDLIEQELEKREGA